MPNTDKQDARVLTADEIRALPRASVVWIDCWDGEEKRISTLIAGLKSYDGMLVDEDGCTYRNFETDMEPDHFDGSRWTFWSAMPTRKQREKAVLEYEQRKTD